MRRCLLVGLAVVISLAAVFVVAFFYVSSALYDFQAYATSCVKLNGYKSCHTKNKNPYRHYGTKTAYHIVAPKHTEEIPDFGECTPKLFYLLSRHSTRYPDEEAIENFIERLPTLKQHILTAFDENRSNICQSDIEKLKLWQLNMTLDDENKITDSGKQEAMSLAERYKQKFPTILDREFSPYNFIFQFTSKRRTLTTAEAFAKGLFGVTRSIHFYGQSNDKVLRFHDKCKEFQKRCGTVRNITEEAEKIRTGPFAISITQSVSLRLGFDVTWEDVQIMYKICAFGYALGQNDAWCSVFSKDDLKVIEYIDDGQDYYKSGYGHDLNHNQACPVIHYLTELLRSSRLRRDLRAVLQFTHAGAIKKVYAGLGLFKDKVPLMANNFCSLQDRKWKNSLMCPFNSNLAVVLLQCGQEEHHKIAVYHDEKPITIAGCCNTTTLCPLEDFFATYGQRADECNIEEICCKR